MVKRKVKPQGRTSLTCPTGQGEEVDRGVGGPSLSGQGTPTFPHLQVTCQELLLHVLTASLSGTEKGLDPSGLEMPSKSQAPSSSLVTQGHPH